jgi:hypothetical protein
MKRRSREISVFSTSAIDLFASAMGAFIIIALVLIVNKSPTPVPVVDPTPLQQKIQQLQQALQQAQQAQAAAESAAAQAAAEANSRPAAMLGIVTDAKSFVVVLDMSKSMQQYEEITRETTDEILDSMSSTKKVQILGFHSPDSGTNLPAWKPPRQLAAMSPQETASAKTFIGTCIAGFNGGTPTRAALLEALQYDAEAILLCSDGEPTDANGNDPMTIVQEVTQLNAGRKKIYSIAIGNFVGQPGFTQFLSKLAASNGGKFIGVFNPSP